MDANELATIAIDAMPLEVLAPADKGQVWGVLQMALRFAVAEIAKNSVEMNREREAALSHNGTLTLKLRDAKIELDALTKDRDAVMAANHTLNADLRKAQMEHQFTQKKLDRAIDELCGTTDAYNALLKQCDALKEERDNAIAEANRLTQENSRLHRSLEERMTVRIPGQLEP